MAKVCIGRGWFSSAPKQRGCPCLLPTRSAGKCCWFLSCGAFPPPPLSAQPPTSSIRNDCRKVHLITSKLHLHFISISHLPSSSLFYSNFSIHHLFFSPQSSLLFLIYTVFSPQEFCSRRAHAGWIVLVHPWDLLHFLWTSHHPSAAFPAQPPPVPRTIQVPVEHWCISPWLAPWACQSCFIAFLQLQLKLLPSSSNSFTSGSPVYGAVSFKWFPSNQHHFSREGSDFSLQ